MLPYNSGLPLDRPGAAPAETASKKSLIGKKMDTVVSLFHSAAQKIHKTVDYIKNPIDSDWRKNQKYQYVMEGLLEGLEKTLGEHPPESATFKMSSTLKQLKENPHVEGSGKPPPGSIQECREHLMRALSCLSGGKKGRFETERERYKAVMESFHDALETKYYQDLVQGKSAEELKHLEQENPLVGTLHALALAQFTQVNTQNFTGDLTRQLAENGGYRKQEETSSSTEHPLKRGLAALKRFNEGIKKADVKFKMSAIAQLGPTVKGHHQLATLDPLITGGNPANIKGIVKMDGKELTMIRTPTPTIGPKVNPMFRAYLLALKSRGKSHLYVSLQNRLTPSQLSSGKARLQARLGFPREDKRSSVLEALNDDPDLKGAVRVFTLDKNSGFYWQKEAKSGAGKLYAFLKQNNLLSPEQRSRLGKEIKHNHTYPEAVDEMMVIYNSFMKGTGSASMNLANWDILKNKEAFQSEFKKKVWTENGSFYLPPEFRGSPHKKAIEKIIESVGRELFPDKVTLTPRERQDFIEIAQAVMTAYFLKQTNADCYNTTCKDCVDRGGAQTSMMLFSFLLMEEADHPERREALGAAMENLPAKLNEDAVFAKKRGILSERSDRIEHALALAVDKSEIYVKLLKDVLGGSSAEVILEERKEQKAKLETSTPKQILATEALPVKPPEPTSTTGRPFKANIKE